MMVQLPERLQVRKSEHTAKQFSQEQPMDQMTQPASCMPARLDQSSIDGLAEAYVSSRQYVHDASPQTAQHRPQSTKRHMYLVSSDSMCLEVTLRIAKTVQHDSGQESYRCMLNICDGNGLEISQSYLHTPCLLVVESALKELAVNWSKEKGSKCKWVEYSTPVLTSMSKEVEVLDDNSLLMRRHTQTLMPDPLQNEAAASQFTDVLTLGEAASLRITDTPYASHEALSRTPECTAVRGSSMLEGYHSQLHH